MFPSIRPSRPPRRDDESAASSVRSAMPTTAEQLLPWLGAATLAAGFELAVSVLGFPLTLQQQAALTVVLAGTLTAAGLLAARSNKQIDLIDREERARPARDELTGIGDSDPLAEDGAPAYFTCMEGWTNALLDLFDHAVDETKDPACAEELAEAAEDTRALRSLLRSSTDRGMNLNEAAMLHTVVTLWEADQQRLEALAAQVDPRWHRRWRARTVIHRQLRHGLPTADHLVLPYRS